jgi:hypothetical protein
MVLVRARVSNLHSVALVATTSVLNEKIVAFVGVPFSVLQSSIHEEWARAHSSTLRLDMQYTPSDCFDTFSFPKMDAPNGAKLDIVGMAYDTHRCQIMRQSNGGLTKTYNLFHDPTKVTPSICRLRELHVEIDEAVKQAYGWGDLRLEHGFHETKQGLRYTISEAARVEVLDRLLALNHERYAEEVKAGLHPETKKGKAVAKGAAKALATAKAAAAPKAAAVPKKRGKAADETQQRLLGDEE